MCASHDVVKQDGFYVCQSCGTKYTPDDAKKLMVDVSGSSVRVDNTDELKKLYEVARRAKSEHNSEQAAEYYGRILMLEPDSWEANFYKPYYTAMQTNIANIVNAEAKVTNAIASTMQLIAKNVQAGEPQVEAVRLVSADTILIAQMFAASAVKHYKTTDSSIRFQYFSEMHTRVMDAAKMTEKLANAILKNFPNNKTIRCNSCVPAWKNSIELIETARKQEGYFKAQPYATAATEYAIALARLIEVDEPEYAKPILQRELNSLKSSYAITGITKAGNKKRAERKSKKVVSVTLVWALIFFAAAAALFVAVANDMDFFLLWLAIIVAFIGVIILIKAFPNAKKREASQKLAEELAKECDELKAKEADVAKQIEALG